MGTIGIGKGTSVIAVATVLFVSACGAAEDGRSVTLRAGYMLSDSNIMATEGILPFAKEVEQESNGSITIETYPDAQLADPGDELKAVEDDILDLAMIIPPYSPEELPLNQAWGLPFGMNTYEAMNAGWRVVHEDNVLSDEFRDAGLVPLMVRPTTPYEFQTTDTPLDSLASFDGRRFRAPSDVAREIIRAAGGEAVNLASTETYEALDRGTIDGTFYYFASLKDMSLDDLLHHSTIDLEVAIGGMQVFVISTDDWAALTETQQDILYEAGKAATLREMEALEHLDEAAQKRLEQAGTLKTYEWSESDRAELSSRMDDVNTAWAEDMGTSGEDAIATIERAVAAARDDGIRTLPDYEVKHSGDGFRRDE